MRFRLYIFFLLLRNILRFVVSVILNKGREIHAGKKLSKTPCNSLGHDTNTYGDIDLIASHLQVLFVVDIEPFKGIPHPSAALHQEH